MVEELLAMIASGRACSLSCWQICRLV